MRCGGAKREKWAREGVQSDGRAMGADREQKATRWGERRAAPWEAARDGLTLVTNACFTPNWSEIRISTYMPQTVQYTNSERTEMLTIKNN